MSHHQINYLEIPVNNIAATKDFFKQVFSWHFQDYGPQYSCFLNVGIDGGFFESDSYFTTATGSPLIVLYSQSLEQTQRKVIQYGGVVNKPVFTFPGGRRFHFLDVNGNEFAVWSE
ncbi:VOC family protein [Shewanella sp. OMA3-2]|uniref:VOC family protein n=1 Tax=Shewanella sp. OMA3-2 TaxID=2908650 RepID=UPI001F3778DC|nr:VOC family protein [Shewanella sp. OMA3-2]UJF20629.1 VOC family protein [Shewanella sp. OMA3-2]